MRPVIKLPRRWRSSQFDCRLCGGPTHQNDALLTAARNLIAVSSQIKRAQDRQESNQYNNHCHHIGNGPLSWTHEFFQHPDW